MFAKVNLGVQRTRDVWSSDVYSVASLYIHLGMSTTQDMTRREQYGHIINISSMSGHRVPNAASGGAFYAATKYALRALTEGLRQEVRP